MKERYHISDFSIGTRIEIHPATNRWMMGDRYGEVKTIGRKVLQVQMDRSGKTIRVHPDNIGRILFAF